MNLEATCGTLTARLKGSGMRWDADNAEAILALEVLSQSGQWEQQAIWRTEVQAMTGPTIELQTRKPNLLDVSIFVAATAIGFAAIRGVPDVLHALPSSPKTPFLLPRPALDIALILLASWPLPAMWTIALLAMRLRPPRPAWRRLGNQPGVASCWAVAISSAFNALLIAAVAPKFGFVGDLLPIAGILVGLSVLVAWTNLWLTGRWRRDPTFFDRAGRVMGIYWVATVPLSLAVFVTILR